MSWVCSSSSVMPIAAKPSRSALPNGYGWMARTARGVERTAAESRAPVDPTTSSTPALPASSSKASSQGK